MKFVCSLLGHNCIHPTSKISNNFKQSAKNGKNKNKKKKKKKKKKGITRKWMPGVDGLWNMHLSVLWGSY